MSLRPTYKPRRDCANTVTYLIRYLIAEPRDAAYALPRRIACRLLRRHNATCDGRPDHQHLRGRRT